MVETFHKITDKTILVFVLPTVILIEDISVKEITLSRNQKDLN